MKKIILAGMLWVACLAGFAQVPPSTTTTTTTVTPATPAQPAATPQQTAAAPQENQQSVTKEDNDYPHFYIGAKGLATITKLDYKKINDQEVKATAILGYGIGGHMGYNFSRNFALQLEVLYSSLVQKVTFDNIDRKIKLNYVNIPLLMVLNTDVSKPVNLNVCIGPQVGIRVKSDIETETSNSANPDTISAILAVRPADLGIAYGAGLDFRLGDAVSLGLGFRGVYGIIDIAENSKNTTTNNFYILDRSKLKTYSAYAGLTFNF